MKPYTYIDGQYVEFVWDAKRGAWVLPQVVKN